MVVEVVAGIVLVDVEVVEFVEDVVVLVVEVELVVEVVVVVVELVVVLEVVVVVVELEVVEEEVVVDVVVVVVVYPQIGFKLQSGSAQSTKQSPSLSIWSSHTVSTSLVIISSNGFLGPKGCASRL